MIRKNKKPNNIFNESVYYRRIADDISWISFDLYYPINWIETDVPPVSKPKGILDTFLDVKEPWDDRIS